MVRPVQGGAADIERLEQDIETVKHLISIWQKFYSLLLLCFDPSASLEQHDPEFQKVKQVIAERHELLMRMVTHDHYVAQNILNMMRRAISLQTFQQLSELEIRKSLIDWHDANILLYETLGNLTYERDQIERQKELGLVRSEASMRPGFFRSLFTARRLRKAVSWIVTLAILGAIIANWKTIESSTIYRQYLVILHGPVNLIKSLLGVPTEEENPDGGPGHGQGAP